MNHKHTSWLIVGCAALMLGWGCQATVAAQDQAKPWQLAEGQFIAAKMPPVLIFPRPDNETPGWARHRKAYPGIAYRVPVVVQGGAYPFYYEVLEGPAGMTIGQRHGDDDYGILTWTPEWEAGPVSVRVRVTDQQQTQVEVRFAVRATKQGFLFLDPEAAAGGDGSMERPFKDFAAVHKNDYQDNTFAGHILYLRGGTHTLTGAVNSNGNFRIDNNNKPVVWLGYPGEEAMIDARNAAVNFISGGSDAFMQGFSMTTSRPDLQNSRFFFFGGSAGDRSTFFEIDFDGLTRGTAGNDNPGAIVMFARDAPQYRQYVVFQSCTIENYAAPLVGSIYTTQYAVADRNVLGKGSQPSVNQGIFPKAANDFWSIRENVSIEQDFTEGAIEQMMGPRAGFGVQRLEIAYNLVRVPSANRFAIKYNWRNSDTKGHEVWVYRNTLIGRVNGLGGTAYTVTLENNAILTNDNPPIQASDNNRVVVSSDNITGAYDASVLDENHHLIGEHRSRHGTHGHVIASPATD